MSYLIVSDYFRFIQDVSLQQVISGNTYFQATAELAALKELSSYLRQKYDVDQEFTDTKEYSATQVYKAGDRVVMDITEREFPQMYFAKLPQEKFQIDKSYQKGDKVFYKDHTYEALQGSLVYSHEIKLQYYDTSSIPSANYFPDDISGRSYWKDLGAYQVAAGTLLSNTDYWTRGDNRHPQLVMFTIDIAVYHLYCRVAPKSIPETRVDRYNAAIAWCRMTAKGDISADIQRVQPDRGNRIRFGSQVKNQNNY